MNPFKVQFNLLVVAVAATLLPPEKIEAAIGDHMVAYYAFDDGSGDTLAELTGNGSDGELFQFEGDGSEWTDGIIGGALEFDGFDDYVIAPSYQLAEDALSVSIWAYANEAPVWASLVKNWGGSLVGQFHLGLGPGDADTANIFITDGAGNAFNAGTDLDDMPLEEWQHVAFVADPAEGLVTLYRNGESVDEQPYDGTFTDTPNSEALGIGVKTENTGSQADGGAPGYWNGRLDDLGIWTRALSAAEVTQIYNAGLEGMPILDFVFESPGDFDGNGALEAADIDLLSAEVRSGNNRAAFDLNGDGSVDNNDRIEWVETQKNTYFGDSNLDGEFNTADFVQVFQLGEYEDGIAANSTWEDGDWNGDEEFDSSDFVIAFQGGGFEQGPRAATASVPEPTSWGLALMAIVVLAVRRRA